MTQTRKEIIEMLKVLKAQALKSHNDTAIIDVKKDSFIYVMNVAINSLEIDERYELEYEQIELCGDAVSREELLKAIDTWDKFGYTETGCFVRKPKGDYVPYIHYDDVIKSIKGMPPVKPQVICPSHGVDCEDCPEYEPKMWNNHQIACMLADLFGDVCACNYNGIDEWLPRLCDFEDTCPSPGGVACWEQFLKYSQSRYSECGSEIKDKDTSQEPKTGHWIELGCVGNDNYNFKCSECHHIDTQSKTVKVNYCWYCGAKMEGDEL